MIWVPVGLCSVSVLHQILQRQLMQTLFVADSLNDIPAKPINVYPSAPCPFFLGLIQEGYETRIIEVALDHTVLRKVDYGDFTLGLKCRHGRMSSIGEPRVITGFGTRLP